MDTDRQWQRFGEVDPYFGVVSYKEFRTQNLTPAGKSKFLQRGERDIAAVFAVLDDIQPGFRPERTLDFGCGVARVLIPLARRSGSAVGVDVSPGMLAEASRNLAEHHVDNVELARAPQGDFDLIHSSLVFQHIAPRRGLVILRDLISRMRIGGIFVLQVPIHWDAPLWRRTASGIKRAVPGLSQLANLFLHVPLNYPVMDMYCYPLPQLLLALRDGGMEFVRIDTHQIFPGGYSSGVIYAQRLAGRQPQE